MSSENLSDHTARTHGITREWIENVLNGFKEEAAKLVVEIDKLKKLLFAVLKKLENLPVIGQYIEDIPLLCSMVGDYANGRYKEVPLASILVIIAALIYFLSPLDLIPDQIPIIGVIDDAAVIAYVIATFHNDIQAYKKQTGYE